MARMYTGGTDSSRRSFASSSTGTGSRQAERRSQSGTRRRRGFASMDPEKQRAIASKGGKTAHARGTANKFQEGSELARRAGAKGGRASRGGGRKAA